MTKVINFLQSNIDSDESSQKDGGITSEEAQRHTEKNEKVLRKTSFVRAVTELPPNSVSFDMKSVDLDEVELIERKKSAVRDRTTKSKSKDIDFVAQGKAVDYVLVYEENKEGDDEELAKEEKNVETRENFEGHLRKQGLVLHHVDSSLNEELNKVFVLIHAPWDVLTRIAEEMMIRAPIREAEAPPTSYGLEKVCKSVSDWVSMFNPPNCGLRKEKRYVTAFFSREKEDCFLIQEKETFFSDIDRSRMVARILRSTRYSAELDDFGIDRLLYDGVYSAAYPLHDGPANVSPNISPSTLRQRLRCSWACVKQWYKYQPLNAIQDYFGTRVALYFAWVGTYNMLLIPAALVGLICFLGGLGSMETFISGQEICDKKNARLFYMCPLCDIDCSYWSLTTSCKYAKLTHLFDHEGTVFFAVFMSLWATLFLEIWKRRQISLAFEWDMINFEEDFEPPRPNFVAAVKEKRPNPITGVLEPFIPYSTQLIRQTCAFMIVIVMILLVIAAVVGVVIYRAAMSAALHAYPDEDVRRGARIITSITASTINLVAITILSFIYDRIAVLLTDWENPRTTTEYTDALTLKMFLFQSVNMYSSLFYIAFFKSTMIVGVPGRYRRIGGGRLEGCDPSGCLIELCIQLAIILVGKQIFSLISKFVIPCLMRWWNRRSQRNLLERGELDQWERDYLLNPEPEFRMFYEYHDMVIQFGFVTLFVAAFPLAPFFALLNNIVELRIDAINFVVNFRRPVAQRAQDIGSWLNILQTMSKFAVLVNSFVIAFTSEFIPRLVYKMAYSPDGTLKGYVNNSLSQFNVQDFEKQSVPHRPFQNLPYNNTHCRYKEYFESTKPYDYSRHFYYVLAARLAFILIFQYVVFFTVNFLNWLIPDVPYALDIRIKQERYISQQLMRKMDEDECNDNVSASTLYVSCESLSRRRGKMPNNGV